MDLDGTKRKCDFSFIIIKQQTLVFLVFSLFLAVSSVPGGFKQLRVVRGKKFHLVASISEDLGSSYDQKREFINF